MWRVCTIDTIVWEGIEARIRLHAYNKFNKTQTRTYSQPPALSAAAAAAVRAATPEPVFYASTGRNQPLLPPQVKPPAPTTVGGVGPMSGGGVDMEDYEISRYV